MTEFYQIHELAKLFGLCADTLRYYEEKGMLHPTRGENRYRRYSIGDICTLNIIRSLRDVGLPVEGIRDYLNRRTVGESLKFLDKEEGLLLCRMEELEQARQQVRARRERLLRYGDVRTGEVTFRHEEARPYAALRQDVILEGEIDFLLKKLETRYQDALKILGRQYMGAVLNEERLAAGMYNHFACVFFLTEGGQPYDGVLPAGEYACLYYGGSYTEFERHYKTLLAGISRAGRRPVGAPLELYRVDAHDTNIEAEYLTEIQVQVEARHLENR